MTAQHIPLKSRPGSSLEARRPAAAALTAKKVAPAYTVSRSKVAAQRLKGAKTMRDDLSDGVGKLSPLQTHDLATAGVPVVQARALMASFRFIERGAVLKAVGISERTLQRGKSGDKLLDPNTSDRALRLASVIEQATDVLGSREAAERWLSAPAMFLDRRRPIELLQSTEGTALVKTLLTRMDYGVYA